MKRKHEGDETDVFKLQLDNSTQQLENTSIQHQHQTKRVKLLSEDLGRPLSPCSNSSSSAASSIAFGRGAGPEYFQLALRLPSGRRLANIKYSAERTPLQIITEVIPEANRATIAHDYTAFINEVPRRQLILDAPLWAQNIPSRTMIFIEEN
ncbi:Oidioi.mRNA.OKI2018_I69.chr2.g6607.t1.cds [Oikopleura dioica]|uniref:Oidioi.mRNA.OKI2018_I69.chr2.g6607.t1.cds n=1 Tax=Oikopleura dioica TaxID=34765 RepID=A0ABN7T8C8_OIKDI|nr:Oidioi.mRNA.OKI2018_I69.chr2.g6607.t1.cds [Oikopleura dioica]